MGEPRSSTTSFLTATTLIYAIGAGITAAAGTRLALQLFLVKRFKLYSFQLRDPNEPPVSQAPSPESNPNSPLPVKTMGRNLNDSSPVQDHAIRKVIMIHQGETLAGYWLFI
ncbi:hypothetical protein Glove_218g24 [Diversispora epigaea]|uniref:Uncharacterized protein n=1 Tax=Diversispora epigaea TaxID=1348612 RepID=A0A397IPV8_9GLOM|nr:hypothetical protein Glove_218g24 [Diversispora epigaea]